MTTMERIAYDEFGLFHENASEYGIQLDGNPSVRRTEVEVASGRAVSALVWGTSSPHVVFVHGGAQNAHTWDTVILALGPDVSAVAVDLPGHGHSGWRDDGAYTPQNLADDIAVAITQLAPYAAAVVGMSLGGMTSMQLAVRRPALVRKLMLVDITPGVNQQKAKAVLDFVNGPQSFPSFESLLERTMEHNPTRAESSLRRGILHNAHQLDDGSWLHISERRTKDGGYVSVGTDITRIKEHEQKLIDNDSHLRANDRRGADRRRRPRHRRAAAALTDVGRLRAHRLPAAARPRRDLTRRR